MFHKQEPDEFALPAELAAVEKQLANLTPAAPRVDRDRLMFAAGQASAIAGGSPSVARPQPPTVWLWPATTALMTAATILLATMLVWQRQSAGVVARPQANVVLAAAGDANESEPIVARREIWPWSDRVPSGYLGVRYVALTQGVGALDREFPAVNGDAGKLSPPATAGQLLEELLPTPQHTSS